MDTYRELCLNVPGEYEALRDSAHRFAKEVLRPAAAELDRMADPNDYDTRTVGRYFNTAAFTAAPQFVIGNSSRNPVRGPGLQNTDLMIGKTFRITERINFEFRAEAFNVSNTPPLNDPNASFGSAAFGSITSAGNPRDFEFAVKLKF